MADKINIIDLEATCWLGQPPEGQANEIIEVGIAVLDVAALKVVERRSIIVKPERSEVSAFCTELTGHTPESVAGGISFAAACEVLRRDFAAATRAWASWGDYDRKQIERQCAAGNVAYPLSKRHTNAKMAFARAFGVKKKSPGMANALKLAGLPLAGRHHSGVDDAANIASLVALLIGRGAWPESAEQPDTT